MNALLLTWIVFFCGAREVLSSPLRVKRSDAQEIEKLTGLLNAMRQEVGQAVNQPMQVLVHDSELDGIAGGLPGNCDNWEHGQGYRLTPLMMNENGMKMWAFYLAVAITPEALDAINAASVKKMSAEEFLNKGTLFALEFFHPDQNKIGCAQVSCSWTAPDALAQVLQMNGNTVQFYGACALGPHANLDSKKMGEVAKSQDMKGKFDKISNEQAITRETPSFAKFLFSISLVLIISLF